MNGLRHGLCARTVVLPELDEKQEDFDEIYAGLHDEFQPSTPSEHDLVGQAAIARWKMARADAYEARSCKENPSDEARCAVFCKMSLVTGRFERSYFKAYHELQRIKALRPKQQPQPDQPDEPEEWDESQDEVPDTGINLFWVNPRTGVRTLAAQSPEAKRQSDLLEKEGEPPDDQ
jgi:hypothetical protein